MIVLSQLIQLKQSVDAIDVWKELSVVMEKNVNTDEKYIQNRIDTENESVNFTFFCSLFSHVEFRM